MLRGLLFDLDGTLVDSDPLHYQVWRDLLASFGIPLSEADFRARISGRLNPDILRDFLPALPDAEVTRLAAAEEASFRARTRGLAPTRGLPELIALAEAHDLRRAVVTNAPRENAEVVLAELGMTERFHTIVDGAAAGRGKPDPAPYRLALDRLGLAPEEAIAFEDSPTGIASAHGAGVRVVGILSVHGPERLLEAGAELVIPDFAAEELRSLLHALGVAGALDRRSG